MASVEDLIAVATPASLILDGIRRTRDLYTYLTPASLSSVPPVQHNKADTLYDAANLTPSLIPFVQLVALRCDTAKAIMNVIDQDTMVSALFPVHICREDAVSRTPRLT